VRVLIDASPSLETLFSPHQQRLPWSTTQMGRYFRVAVTRPQCANLKPFTTLNERFGDLPFINQLFAINF
jgi:hypothetical protein